MQICGPLYDASRSERSQPGLHRALANIPPKTNPERDDLDHARNPVELFFNKREITFGSGSPLLRLEHEKLVGPGFSAPDFALAARELPYTGVGVG